MKKIIVKKEVEEKRVIPVRFFAAGEFDKDGFFTGMIHDNDGAGSYREYLIFKDKLLPRENGNDFFDWDEQVEIFDKIATIVDTNLSVDRIKDDLREYIDYDTKEWNYVVLEEKLDKFDGDFIVEGMDEDLIPYGIGLSHFDNGQRVSESWTVEEIDKLESVAEFVDNLNNADCIRIGDSPLLEYWSVVIDEEYDLISTSWNEDDLEYQFGLNFDNIEDVEFKDGRWLISTFGKNYQEKITLYKMETLGGEI